MKKIILLAGLAGIGLFFNSCYVGYVASEPTYVEVSRPPRPSDSHIWVNGDWSWDRQNQVYIQRNGYWEKPNQRQTYVSGRWESSPRGKYWAPGHWQKQGRQGKNSKR